jgi:uncharacterized protein (TIGR03437 family)
LDVRIWATILLLCGAAIAYAQPKRVLYVTHSAGFRHDVLPVSAQVLRDIAAHSGRIEVVATEDLSLISEASLRNYDALFFFTSGELPLSTAQKQALLAFVRDGKGFGGAHSATDTLYLWPEYGDLIGAYFNGHPWAHEVRVDVEDPDHPIAKHLVPSFSVYEEIYQFRDLSRDRVRVLMTLDTRSVNMNAEGTNPGTEDFPLAWVRNYGQGRVFYIALGHAEHTWRDPQFQQILLEAMLWLTRQTDGDASPRSVQPRYEPARIGNAATMQPPAAVSPGALVSIFGEGLTTGSTMAAGARNPAYKLAGTVVKLDGIPIPLLYASPSQINAFVPLDLKQRDGSEFELLVAPAGVRQPGTVRVAAATATPGVFTITRDSGVLILWATGLGPVEPRGSLQVTTTSPTVLIDGEPARVLFSGLAPGWIGLYQVNVESRPSLSETAFLEFEFAGHRQKLGIPR